MKKVLFIIALFISIVTEAQKKQQLGTYGVIARRLQADSAIRLPTFRVGIKDNYEGFDTAQLYYKTADSSIYVYTGFQWAKIGGGSGSTPTWQNTLLTSGGSEITTSIDVEGNGNGFNFQNFGDFNINTNGGLGLSFNNGIYGSGSITHNTGAIGFDIYHNAAGEESQVYFGAGRLWMLHGIKTKFEVKTDTATVEADNFRINIPSAGAGKILVSNANGNATWQTPAPSGRFGYPGEDYSAGEHRDFNMHDTYQMTFDSLAGFVVKNSGRNRIYMDGTSTALFSPSISGSNAAGFVSTNGVARIYQGLSNQILLRGDTTVAIQRISYNSNIASTFTPYSLVTKKYVDSTVSSVSVTPPGNYGNIQLNRNGAFATPASDSLSFSSSTLNVKGDVGISDGRYLKIGGSNILNYYSGSNNATFAGAYNFLFNNGGNVFMNTANTTYFSTSTGDLYFSGSGKLGIGTATPDSSLTVTAGIWGKRGVRFTGLPSSHNADDSMLVVNASNGTVGYRPVTPSLTSTQIAFGDGSNLMTGSSDLIADASGGAGFMQIGINTTPGGQALSVKGQTVLGLTNTYNISGMLGTNNNVAYMGDAEQNGSGNVIQVKDGDGISYYDNTSHTGKFGVNTSTPGGPLHVKANAGAIDALFVDGTTGNVGIGTATPNSTLHNNGSFAGNYIATATGITLDATNYVVAVTATGQTVTLPDAVGIDGRIYTIKLTAFGSCTVSTTGGETIDASGTYSLASQYKYVTIMSNGANWIVIGNN